MELLEFLEEVVSFFPKGYENISNVIMSITPWILLSISLIVCFLGYRFVKVWSKIYFFGIGFLIGAFSGIFFLSYNLNIWIFIIFGIILGLIAAYFSKYLHKAQIFITNFIASFLVLPNLLGHFLADSWSVGIALIFSIIFALLSIKFKFIITVITTSIQGGFFAAGQLKYIFGYSETLWVIVSGIMFTILGFVIQILIGKEKNIKQNQIKENQIK